jgi:hypothetical protein
MLKRLIELKIRNVSCMNAVPITLLIEVELIGKVLQEYFWYVFKMFESDIEMFDYCKFIKSCLYIFMEM